MFFVYLGMSPSHSWMCFVKLCMWVSRGNNSRSNIRMKGSSCSLIGCPPGPWNGLSERYPCVAKLRSAICSHPSMIWITVARGESYIKARKSFALVVSKPCSQVTNCMLSRRPSARIANVFAAGNPISVVVSGICSFSSVGTR